MTNICDLTTVLPGQKCGSSLAGRALVSLRRRQSVVSVSPGCSHGRASLEASPPRRPSRVPGRPCQLLAGALSPSPCGFFHRYYCCFTLKQLEGIIIGIWHVFKGTVLYACMKPSHQMKVSPWASVIPFSFLHTSRQPYSAQKAHNCAFQKFV